MITAYSSSEAIGTFQEFPKVSGIVFDAEMPEIRCGLLIQQLRTIRSDVPVIVVHAPGSKACDDADHQLETFDPASLLHLLKKLEPQPAAVIEARGAELV